jgi:hypothetical protein
MSVQANSYSQNRLLLTSVHEFSYPLLLGLEHGRLKEEIPKKPSTSVYVIPVFPIRAT